MSLPKRIARKKTEKTSRFHKKVAVEDFSDVLAGIQSALGVSMKDFSEILHVPCSTVYSWMEPGNEPQGENRERLSQIQRIAKRWNTLSNYSARNVLKNSLSNGSTLLEMLREKNIVEQEINQFLPKAAERVNREYEKNLAKKPTQQNPSTNLEIDLLTPVVFFPQEDE